MKEVIMKMVNSRKFWYGFSILMVIMFSEDLGISETKMNSLLVVGVALIIGQGLADKSCNMKR
ncbi:MAG: hypothetical protein CMH18_08190 [Methylophaga sp.]|nr:hypothetical protein [Methylophaga sp.]|tara:strand:- start:287 stop:475 length:189 start_codon:yes stop_codon:yes gene_type:complete